MPPYLRDLPCDANFERLFPKGNLTTWVILYLAEKFRVQPLKGLFKLNCLCYLCYMWFLMNQHHYELMLYLKNKSKLVCLTVSKLERKIERHSEPQVNSQFQNLIVHSLQLSYHAENWKFKLPCINWQNLQVVKQIAILKSLLEKQIKMPYSPQMKL